MMKIYIKCSNNPIKRTSRVDDNILIETKYDSWIIGEFFPFKNSNSENEYENADKERMLAIECRNAMPKLLKYIKELEKSNPKLN